MKYTTQLIKKEEVANGTMAFHLKKPEGFTYKAGQNMDFTIVNPPETDAEGNTRPFSLASSPSEGDIYFATRMRDTAFKRVLRNSDTVTFEIDGPMGDFTLHQRAERPAVFIIGGIGITPVYSILKDAAEKKLPHKLYLFYSNKTEKDAPFFSELKSIAARHKNLAFVPTFTKENVAGAEKGIITESMVEKYLKDKGSAIFYLAGPSAMVSAMRSMLNAMNISDDDIKTEEFSGY